MADGKKIAVMSDGNQRVLISSIASYSHSHVNLGGSKNFNVGIDFVLKSGKTLSMDFGKRFLRDQAVEWLDEQMGVEILEYKPCDRCAMKDKQRDAAYSGTYCEVCFASQAYPEYQALDTSL